MLKIFFPQTWMTRAMLRGSIKIYQKNSSLKRQALDLRYPVDIFKDWPLQGLSKLFSWGQKRGISFALTYIRKYNKIFCLFDLLQCHWNKDFWVLWSPEDQWHHCLFLSVALFSRTIFFKFDSFSCYIFHLPDMFTYLGFYLWISMLTHLLFYLAFYAHAPGFNRFSIFVVNHYFCQI